MPEYPEFNPKTIMVATDFSSASCGAMAYAQTLSRRFKAKLLLTHIIDPAVHSTANESDVCESIDCAEKELQGRLAALNEESIEARVVVRVGDVLKTILHLVDERKVDLLVLGTKGQAQKSGAVVGSVAERLLRAMPCMVLTVGPQDRISVFEGTYTARVMVTTDFSDASKVALGYAESLARRLNGKLYLLHVEDRTPGSHVMSLSQQKERFQSFTSGMRETSQIAEYITCIGSPAERIVRATADKRADLLVMRVHESDQTNGGRLGGVAYDVIRQVRCPVFSLFIPTLSRKPSCAT